MLNNGNQRTRDASLRHKKKDSRKTRKISEPRQKNKNSRQYNLRRRYSWTRHGFAADFKDISFERRKKYFVLDVHHADAFFLRLVGIRNYSQRKTNNYFKHSLDCNRNGSPRRNSPLRKRIFLNYSSKSFSSSL